MTIEHAEMVDKNAILQQLRNAWRHERDRMIETLGAGYRMSAVYSHRASAFVNAIGSVLSNGKVTWDYPAGVAWLKEQGEDGPYQ